jgi:hypothetical protein
MVNTVYLFLKEATLTRADAEDGGIRFLRNVGIIYNTE